jgi:hypothetical protein
MAQGDGAPVGVEAVLVDLADRPAPQVLAAVVIRGEGALVGDDLG